MLSFSQCLVKQANQVLRDGCGEGGGKACENFVCARVVLGQDRLALSAEGIAEVVNHGGHQRATHDVAADKGGKGRSKGSPQARTATRDPGGLPQGVIQKVTAEGGARGGTDLPTKGGKQVVVQEVAVDAHVVHQLGYISALPGKHHLCGGVINASDRQAHLVAGPYRLPSAR